MSGNMPTCPAIKKTLSTVIGNYQQGSSGVLDTEIGGPNPSQADQLKVDGSAKLNGTLDLTSLNGFHPASGNTYEILSASGGLSGAFSMIAGTANTAGLSRLDIYGPNGLIVTYLPPGFGVINLTTSSPLPASLTSGNLNAFLLSILDPTAEQLSSLYEIWFSDANTQRLNIQNAGTGFKPGDSVLGSKPSGNRSSARESPICSKQIEKGIQVLGRHKKSSTFKRLSQTVRDHPSSASLVCPVGACGYWRPPSRPTAA
jgi:hypothetical protein